MRYLHRNVRFGPLSVACCSVLCMGVITDLEQATMVAGSVCDGLDALRDCEFWEISELDLLSLARTLERMGRLVYAAQVHLAGELDTRRVADRFGCTSTLALLRETLCISAGDAAGRVRAAARCYPRNCPRVRKPHRCCRCCARRWMGVRSVSSRPAPWCPRCGR